MTKVNENEAKDMSLSSFCIKEHRLIQYTGHEKNVVIPNGIDVVGRNAFEDCDTLRVFLLLWVF